MERTISRQDRPLFDSEPPPSSRHVDREGGRAGALQPALIGLAALAATGVAATWALDHSEAAGTVAVTLGGHVATGVVVAVGFFAQSIDALRGGRGGPS